MISSNPVTERSDAPIQGMCSPGPILTLGDLTMGNVAAVKALGGGSAFSSRMAVLGFTPGARVKMLQNRGQGPVIVSVRDTRIALGRGEAEKVQIVMEGAPS